MNLKAIYQTYAPLIRPVLFLKNRLFSLRCRGLRGNRISGLEQCRMKRCRVVFSGKGNTLEIGDMCTLDGVTVTVTGSNNRIVIGSRCSLLGCSLTAEDDGNEIRVGEHTYIYGGTELAALEGTRLTLGRDCLLSAGITLRTGDSHSVLSQGRRINPSADVTLEDHVWIGRNAVVLKNAHISRDCVVAASAVVTSSAPSLPGTILAGNPARAVREDINWDISR